MPVIETGLKRSRRSLKLWCLVTPLLAIICLLLPGQVRAGELPSSGLVVAVLDGDTVVLGSGERVRYLGIDAPEVSHRGDPADCMGAEAKRYNSSLVLHRRVMLTYDGQTRDSYGRLLAYVDVGHLSVNAELVRSGLACVYRTSMGPGRVRDYINLQRYAVRDRSGMWACPVLPSSAYIGNVRSFVMHRLGCKFARSISRRDRALLMTRLQGLDDGYRPCRTCRP